MPTPKSSRTPALRAKKSIAPKAPRPAASTDIRIRGARQNNLKNLDVDIHTGQLTVVEVERFRGNLPPIRAFDPPPG